jgi:hypothetical protein
MGLFFKKNKYPLPAIPARGRVICRCSRRPKSSAGAVELAIDKDATTAIQIPKLAVKDENQRRVVCGCASVNG